MERKRNTLLFAFIVSITIALMSIVLTTAIPEFYMYLIAILSGISAVITFIKYIICDWECNNNDKNEKQTHNTPELAQSFNSTKAPAKQQAKKSVGDILTPDIRDIVWFNNKFDAKYCTNRYDNEPSEIDLDLPIRFDVHTVEPIGYYPSYKSLSAGQKGRYIKFINSPDLETNDIGYVFIFYYGLERHLYYGDFDKAYEYIIKLRKKYDNASFQNYSANAVILSCVNKKRWDLLAHFMATITAEQLKYLNINELIFTRIALDQPLTVDDILIYPKAFGFTHITYSKKYPELFKKELSNIIDKTYPNGIRLEGLRYANFAQSYNYLNLYANISLSHNARIKFPDFSGIEPFVTRITEMMNQAYENVLAINAANRKK